MQIAGIDIGGTKCAAVLAETYGSEVRFLSRSEIPTAGDSQDVLAALSARLKTDAARTGANIQAIGVSCGGPLSSEQGLILSPPNLPGWNAVPVCAYFAERFNVPVRLMNDANACALAEWRFGAGKNTRNFVFFTFGTGLGAGIILNGKLYEGSNGNAGEAGHIRLRSDGPAGYGKRGSFEGFCSGGGIARLARSIAEEEMQCGRMPLYCGKDVTAKSVAEAAKQGDSAALRVFEETGARLGEGLAIVADILNPEMIALGGVFMRAESLLRAPMERALKRECLPSVYSCLKVVPSELGEKIGDYGALAAAVPNK